MKLKFNLLMMVAVALFMTACSSDDDDSTTNNAQNVAGTYDGYTVADCPRFSIPMTMPDESFSIVANADGTCNISFISDTWGTFTISSASVSLNSSYVISGSGKTVMGMETQTEYDCTVEGTISSDKKTVSIVFTVPSVMGGLDITFALGSAPANMVVASVYEGSLALSVAGTGLDPVDDSKVTIKSQEDGKAEITLGGFGVGSMTLGDIVIADVEVAEESDGSYTISGAIDTTDGTYTVVGSLTGTIKDGEASIEFTIKPGSMPMNITAIFTGSN